MTSESTVTLLERARAGDASARSALFRRFLPRLERWAHGRLPVRGREGLETDDLVQVALLRALKHAGEFEPRHEGAFLAYLRCILVNQIRDQLRRVSRRPERQGLDEQIPDRGSSPVEEAIGSETLERYERSLTELTPE